MLQVLRLGHQLYGPCAPGPARRPNRRSRGEHALTNPVHDGARSLVCQARGGFAGDHDAQLLDLLSALDGIHAWDSDPSLTARGPHQAGARARRGLVGGGPDRAQRRSAGVRDSDVAAPR